MKHLKKFNTTIEYDQFKSGSEFVLPNVSFVVENDGVMFESVKPLTYNMVDLGLPSGTLWADRNVGATSPEDAGLYFAWGETVGYTAEEIASGKRSFTTSEYLSKYDKYNATGFTVLESIDDAVTVNMGTDYRMPTKQELDELLNLCTRSYIDVNDREFNENEAANGKIKNYELKCIRLTGPNGNSIVFPASGSYGDTGNPTVGFNGSTWSSSVYLDHEIFAYYMIFTCAAYHDVTKGYCRSGMTVRGIVPGSYNNDRHVGDVAYYEGNVLKTCALDSYNESMGTAVGVVVIPNNFLPDTKARIVALDRTMCKWSESSTDISQLKNHDKVALITSKGYNNGVNATGYLPSDAYTGFQSTVDSKAKYAISEDGAIITSPYLDNNSFNENYANQWSGTNVNPLSDFNGKGNTDILVGLGSDYVAANIAKNHASDQYNIAWYLPSCGELGVMNARLATINSTIEALGGTKIQSTLLSSTECNSTKIWTVSTTKGQVVTGTKTSSTVGYVYPFAEV